MSRKNKIALMICLFFIVGVASFALARESVNTPNTSTITNEVRTPEIHAKQSLQPIRIPQPNPEPLSGRNPDTILIQTFPSSSIPVGWQAIDLTAQPVQAYWHVDTFLASGGHNLWGGVHYVPTWLCLDGYGNLWNQEAHLALSTLNDVNNIYLRFKLRFDAEYDLPEAPFTTWDAVNLKMSTNGGASWFVISPVAGQAYTDTAVYAFNLQNGTIEPGWSGPVQNWTYAVFNLTPYLSPGNNVKLRWDIAADMYASDQDGGYNSNFGMIMIDSVLVRDSTLHSTIFFDGFEGPPNPAWTYLGLPPYIAGQYWACYGSSAPPVHPCSDGFLAVHSQPYAAFCGDVSNLPTGLYAVSQHNNQAISNALVTPTINLSSYMSVNLSFWYRGRGVEGYGYIEVSSDGGTNWTQTDMLVFPSTSGDWQQYTASISQVAGQSNVKVRFVTQCGTGATHCVYWYIDDVLITGSGTQVELYNDDGTSRWYFSSTAPTDVFAAKLTCPTSNPYTNGWRVKQAKFELYTPRPEGAIGTYNIWLYDAPGQYPGDSLTYHRVFVGNVPTGGHWFTVDLAPYNVTRSNGQPFWVGVEHVTTDDTLSCTADLAQTLGVNAVRVAGVWGDLNPEVGDLMIRAIVDTATVALQHDVSALSVDRPKTYFYPGAYNFVKASVKNLGGFTETFNVQCKIFLNNATTPIYTDTKSVSALTPFETRQVAFNNWVPGDARYPQSPGNTYKVQVLTQLGGDINPANDTTNQNSFAYYQNYQTYWDDNSAENAWAWNQAGSRFATSFYTPASPCTVKAVKWQIWPDWPDLDREPIGLELWNMASGVPTSAVWTTTVTSTDTVPNWNTVNVTPSFVPLTDEFLLSYVQQSDTPSCEGLAVDTTPPYWGHDWSKYLAEAWSGPGMAYGDWMLRANIKVPPIIWCAEVESLVTVQQGHLMTWHLNLKNNTAQSQTFDIWFDIILFNGNPYANNPMIQRLNLVLPGGAQVNNRILTFNIPASAPLGTYQMVVKVGKHYDEVWYQDIMYFQVTAGDNSGSPGWPKSPIDLKF